MPNQRQSPVIRCNVNHIYTSVKTGQSYKIITQNIGFGTYTQDFTFFMDGGTQSWAESEESVLKCINDAAEVVEDFEPDFILLQEVDFDSTRSYHISLYNN